MGIGTHDNRIALRQIRRIQICSFQSISEDQIIFILERPIPQWHKQIDLHGINKHWIVKLYEIYERQNKRVETEKL